MNVSILERNICDSLGAYDDADGARRVFWASLDRTNALSSEKLAHVYAEKFAPLKTITDMSTRAYERQGVEISNPNASSEVIEYITERWLNSSLGGNFNLRKEAGK